MKKTLFLHLFFFLVLCSSAQASISSSDFLVLDNTSWKGTLQYIDFQSGKPTDIETSMQIRVRKKTVTQDIQYVWEPDKNVGDKTKIKKKGRYFGKQEVLTKTKTQDGRTRITTTSKGRDNGKKATFYFTYEFDATHYQVTKDVQYKNEDKRFMRNRYTYTLLP